MMFSEFVEYLESTGLAKKTLRIYIPKAKALFDWHKDKEININAASVNNWLREQYENSGLTETYKLCVVVARRIVKRLVDLGELSEDHVNGLPSVPKIYHSPPTTIPPDDVMKVLDALPSPYDGVGYLLYHLGLRVSEAVTLRWRDVDRKQKLLTIYGKGGKFRQIPYGQTPVEDFIRRRAIETGANPNEFVFPSSRGGTHVDPSTINRHLRDAGKVAGLTRVVKPHALRHACAIRLISAGIPSVTVAGLLGHSSTRVTEQVYLQGLRSPEAIHTALMAVQGV